MLEVMKSVFGEFNHNIQNYNEAILEARSVFEKVLMVHPEVIMADDKGNYGISLGDANQSVLVLHDNGTFEMKGQYWQPRQKREAPSGLSIQQMLIKTKTYNELCAEIAEETKNLEFLIKKVLSHLQD